MTDPPPRLSPLPREEWDAAVAEAFRAAVADEVADRYLSTGADALRVPNAFSTIVRHRRLARAFFAYNRVLLREGTLAPRLRELAILRVAWRTGSAYEWAQHERIARGTGLTDAEIAAVATDTASAATWSATEVALLAATDQLIEQKGVDDATWHALATELDDEQLIELVFVVGTYVCVAMAFRTFGVELDPELR